MYDEEFYNEPDENWEFNAAMNELIEKEVEIRTKSIREDYEFKKNLNKKLQTEVYELKNTLENEKKNNKLDNMKSDFITDILKCLNKDNIESFIKMLYVADFEEEVWGEIPLWFKLVVNYYSHKNKIIEMFNICGISITEEATKLRLPFEWTKEELDVFFETMHNHYVCNGEIYSHNLNHWGWLNACGDPIKNMKTNYSEIPWQFVLRHPLLNTKEYCEKMAYVINKGGNGEYFMQIEQFQKLDDDNLKMLVNGVDIFKFKSPNKSDEFKSLIIKNLHLIEDEAKLDKLYTIVKDLWSPQRYLEQMPKKYYIRYLKENGVNDVSVIYNSKILTDEEKLEILKETKKNN